MPWRPPVDGALRGRQGRGLERDVVGNAADAREVLHGALGGATLVDSRDGAVERNAPVTDDRLNGERDAAVVPQAVQRVARDVGIAALTPAFDMEVVRDDADARHALRGAFDGDVYAAAGDAPGERHEAVF